MDRIPSILLIDPDPELDSSIRSSGDAAAVISSASDAVQGMFSDPARVWVAAVVFLGPESATTLEAIRLCHSHQAGIPILLCLAGQASPLSQDAHRLGITIMSGKPENASELMAALGAEPQGAVFKASAEASKEPIPEEYFPAAVAFWPGVKLAYGVFIRISASKMLKVLHEGDSFSAEQLQGYISKDVGCFYLSKNAQAKFLQFCENRALEPKASVPEAGVEKIQQTVKSGEEIMKLLETQGLTEDNVESAGKFTEELGALVQKIDTSKNDAIKSFLSNVADFEHGVGTSVIASLLAKSCGILSEKFAPVVGLAAMFHDIGLLQLPSELRDEDETKMTEAQKKKFQTHPRLGREALGKVRGIFPVTLQAIEQHHERYDKTGFPLGIGTTKITKLSEIIGLSALFQRVLHRAHETGEDPIEIMVKSHLKHFSQPVRDGFMNAFAKEALAKEAPAAQ